MFELADLWVTVRARVCMCGVTVRASSYAYDARCGLRCARTRVVCVRVGVTVSVRGEVVMRRASSVRACISLLARRMRAVVLWGGDTRRSLSSPPTQVKRPVESATIVNRVLLAEPPESVLTALAVRDGKAKRLHCWTNHNSYNEDLQLIIG